MQPLVVDGVRRPAAQSTGRPMPQPIIYQPEPTPEPLVRPLAISPQPFRRPAPAAEAVAPVATQTPAQPTPTATTRHPEAEVRPQQMPKLSQLGGVSIDGLRRAAPQAELADAMTLPANPMAEHFAQAWRSGSSLLQSVIDARYRIGTGVAASAILASSIFGIYRLQSLRTTQTATANASAATTTAQTPAPTPTATVPQSAELQKLMDGFASSQAAPMGLVIKDLKTGQIASRNPDQVFTSASLYKLFVATTIYKQIDAGKLGLGDTVKGTNKTVASCLSDMITWSDNDCGRALGSMIGWGGQDANLHNLGFKGTTLTDPQSTTAGDVATLFERLYNGTLLSPNSSGQFLDLLKAQKINNRIPAALPAGTVIAHKTGDLDGFVHDAGIVYGPKSDYLVIAVTGPWPNLNAAPGAIADFSKRTFDFFNQ